MMKYGITLKICRKLEELVENRT